MPTVLQIRGWRLFFYSNEGHEPPHIHARKHNAECKFRLRAELFDIEEEWSHGMSSRLRREIRKIMFEHFELIVEEWGRSFGMDSDVEN
ncbi:MAG: DUF4160 domain-containing protein [Planctomycetia bacterium]|nr:DUF4160 domain-containing protein [Planctomycetia bacterium]